MVVKTFGKSLRNRKLYARLFDFEDFGSFHHVSIRGGYFDAVFVKKIFAVKQILCVLHKRNSHHLAVYLHQHVVFDFVLGFVFIYQVSHRLQLTFGLQTAVHTHRDHGCIKRHFAFGGKRLLNLCARIWRHLKLHFEAALGAGFHFFRNMLQGWKTVTDDVDITCFSIAKLVAACLRYARQYSQYSGRGQERAAKV